MLLGMRAWGEATVGVLPRRCANTSLACAASSNLNESLRSALFQYLERERCVSDG